MITHTHEPVGSVKKNRKQQAKDNKRRLFDSLDRKGQAYFGLVEHSGLSLDALGLHQYLLSKQGSKAHAFPSMKEMKQRFRCNHRRIKAALEELATAIPEVFQIVKNGGTSRDSYKLTRFSQWPLHVCERLWFSDPTVGTLCSPTVGTQATKSDPTVGTPYGTSDGDSLDGISRRVVGESVGVAMPPVVDLWAAVAPL